MAAWLASLRKPSVTNQPPTERELARLDWAVLIFVLFSLFLGVGIANNASNASRKVELGEGLPTIQVPSNWITGTPEGDTLFAAMNPRSGSTFNAELKVTSRTGGADANIVTARTALGAQRARDLLRYRELRAQPVTVNGQEGILVTYAYVADPTRDQGAIAPPVVVEAQDLIFPYNGRILVVTMAADAADWDAQEHFFDIVTDSLRMRRVEVDVMTNSLPAAVATAETEEGGE